MRRFMVWLGMLLPLLLACQASDDASPEHIFVEARIYSLAGAVPNNVDDEAHVEAMAVRRGRIVALGNNAEIRSLASASTQVHKMQGATIFPGFVDAHLHMQNLGKFLSQVDLVGTTSFKQVVNRIVHQTSSLPAGSWIEGRGWDQNDWRIKEFPEHELLSKQTQKHPVFVRRIDGHAALINEVALQLCGIDSATPDPPGGQILHRADGSPSGVLVDTAMNLVARKIPLAATEVRLRRLVLAMTHVASKGLTGVHDAGISVTGLEDYRLLLSQEKLTVRIYAMLAASKDPEGRTPTLDYALQHGPENFDATGKLAARCIKLVADGALGSRGATLLEDYSDQPGYRGLPRYSAAEFYSVARALHKIGFQLATHAIGDAANRMVLDQYEKMVREAPRDHARHRIEHAQVLTPEDLTRFATLGVIASMQGTHCTSDMPWAGERLGQTREQGAYAWRSLLDTGVKIANGSDAPVEAVDPLFGIYSSVTRQDQKGWPDAGWHPEQRMTRSEALRSFTAWAAQASFQEDEVGTLEVGKRADFTVFDRDLFLIPALAILDAKVVRTVVGGETVFTAANPTAP